MKTDILPEERKIYERDPDFTKLTPKEAEELRVAREQFENGEIVSHEEINWD